MRRLGLALIGLTIMIGMALPVTAQGTIVDVAASDPQLRTFYRAVQLAEPEVIQQLSQPGSYTVLAPTNAAFVRVADYLGLELEALLQNEAVITGIVRYHIIPGTFFSQQLQQSQGQVIPTLLPGAFIGIGTRDDGTLVFNSAGDVERADISASNGLIHLVDDVLLNRVINETIQQSDFTMTEATEEPTTSAPDDANGTPTPPEVAPAGRAIVRVTHLVTGAPPVEVTIADTTFSGVAYGGVSANQTTTAGESTVTVTTGDATLLEMALTIPADETVTVAIIPGVTADTLQAIAIPQPAADLASESARIIVLNALADNALAVMAQGVRISRLPIGETLTLDIPLSRLDYALMVSPLTEDGEIAAPTLELNVDMFDAGRTYLIGVSGTVDEAELRFFPLTSRDEEPVSGDEITATDGSLLGLLAEDDRFNTLMRAVRLLDPAIQAALADVSGEVYTVFAPTDRAFNNLLVTLNMTVDELLAQPELVQSILLYHVVPGEFPATDVESRAGDTLFTLNSSSAIRVSVTAGGVLRLNDIVTVIDADLPTANGVVHVVDNVLLPADAMTTLGLGN